MTVITAPVLDANDGACRDLLGLERDTELAGWFREHYEMRWVFRAEAFIADGCPALKVDWWTDDLGSLPLINDEAIPHRDVLPVRVGLPDWWKPSTLTEA